VIGAGGVERILEVELTEQESNLLGSTLEKVKATVAETGL
jgi:malate/lactate dehydrogenase